MLRRGADKAEINDLQFSKNSRYIAATSDHNTIHIFSLDPAQMNNAEQAAQNAAITNDEETKVPDRENRGG